MNKSDKLPALQRTCTQLRICREEEEGWGDGDRGQRKDRQALSQSWEFLGRSLSPPKHMLLGLKDRGHGRPQAIKVHDGLLRSGSIEPPCPSCLRAPERLIYACLCKLKDDLAGLSLPNDFQGDFDLPEFDLLSSSEQ